MCACACTHVCITRKKMLVYYPITGIKRIYSQVLNLFPKLSGENKCLHLITSASNSISLQCEEKCAVVYMLFVPNFKITLLMEFIFQLWIESWGKFWLENISNIFQTGSLCARSMATRSVFVEMRNFTIIRTYNYLCPNCQAKPTLHPWICFSLEKSKTIS